MLCDINPDHGPMEQEPMYGVGGVINQYGWFCQVPDCDGYGGPVRERRVHKPVKTGEQLAMFEEVNNA